MRYEGSEVLNLPLGGERGKVLAPPNFYRGQLMAAGVDPTPRVIELSLPSNSEAELDQIQIEVEAKHLTYLLPGGAKRIHSGRPPQPNRSYMQGA